MLLVQKLDGIHPTNPAVLKQPLGFLPRVFTDKPLPIKYIDIQYIVDFMIQKIRSRLQSLQSDYPKDSGIAGYKPYISFSLLAALTYVITFNQYSPELIGSVIYFLPIMTGLTYYIFEDDNRELRQMMKYLLFVLATTFVLYFIYISITQLTFVAEDLLTGSFLSALTPAISLINSLIGIPVTATFYHSIYVYYQILNELDTGISELEEE